MVVEDDQDGAEMVALLLQMNGYRVTVARTGEDALGAAAQATLDVVLLDLRLPGVDGWEVATRLRERSVLVRPLFIAVTGCAGEADERRSAEAGIDLHLVKPVDPADLLAVLGRFARVLGYAKTAGGTKGWPAVPVPWEKADELHHELKKRGYPFTLCLSVATHTARLEPWPGADARPALAALDELLAGESDRRKR
jgi:two-component system OmpR family response regulator